MQDKEVDEKEIGYNRDAVETLLNTSKAEYDNEHSRTSIIDSKVNISLPIMFAFLLAVVQINNYKSIFEMPIEKYDEFFVATVLFLSQTMTLILGTLAVFLMVRVVFSREYKTIKPEDLYDVDWLTHESSCLEIKLIQLYCEASNYNQEQNSHRVNLYRRSWKMMIFSLLFYVVYLLIINNV